MVSVLPSRRAVKNWLRLFSKPSLPYSLLLSSQVYSQNCGSWYVDPKSQRVIAVWVKKSQERSLSELDNSESSPFPFLFSSLLVSFLDHPVSSATLTSSTSSLTEPPIRNIKTSTTLIFPEVNRFTKLCLIWPGSELLLESVAYQTLLISREKLSELGLTLLETVTVTSTSQEETNCQERISNFDLDLFHSDQFSSLFTFFCLDTLHTLPLDPFCCSFLRCFLCPSRLSHEAFSSSLLNLVPIFSIYYYLLVHFVARCFSRNVIYLPTSIPHETGAGLEMTIDERSDSNSQSFLLRQSPKASFPRL